MAVSQSLTVTEVPNSANIADNTSQVKIVWTSTQSGESWNGYTRTANYWVSINGGAETKYSVSYTLPQNSTKTILSKTITVPHKGDGSGTVKVRTWMDTDISAGVVELSKTLTLTTIPRASTIDSLSCATAYFTGQMTYKYTPKSSAMYNRCNISLHLGDEYISVKSINLGKKSASQQTSTVTLTEDELKAVYNELPSAKKGTLRFTFRTYSDSGYSTQVGDFTYKEIELKIPDDSTTKPTVGMTLEASNGNLPDAFEGVYVQGKSKVKVGLTAAPKFKTGIEEYRVKLLGTNYNDTGTSYTSGYLTQTGSVEVIGYAEDARGFTGSMSKKITVVAYSKPKLLDVSALRCNSGGSADDSGAYLRIRATRSYSKVTSGDVQKNFCLIRYRWKPENGSYSSWTTILAKTAASNTVDTGALNLSLSATTSYLVQIQAVDDVGEKAETIISVPTEEVYMHRTKDAMGLGGYVNSSKMLDVFWDAKFRGEVMIGDKTLREYILSIIEGG